MISDKRGAEFGEELSDEAPQVPDPITACAEKTFGIKYLFPWQRLVVANILDAADYALGTAQGESLPPGRGQALPVRAIPPSPEAAAPNPGECAGHDDDRALWSRQIVLLPTGAGKSLCFLLPAVLLPRPSLIIYPLLALMSDQKRRMDSAGLDAVVFRGGQTPEEREENFRKIEGGAKIILANPEVLQSDKLTERLSRVGIIHAVIDEAHCVSEWGDSFRPAYLTLGAILSRLNIPVITAFTATASRDVLARVADVLFGDGSAGSGAAHIVRSDSDRQNLRYYVHRAVLKDKAALLLAAREEKPMIVFCGTRDKTEQTARLFSMCFGRDKIRFYHAGLERDEKKNVEQWFFPKTDAILLSTCAFGMGVDKSDIRTVIHLEAPSTAEAYIQEAGRGGRDGKVSKAILLWSDEDAKKFGAVPEGSRGRVMFDFAEKGTCRRQILLDALGGEQAACSGCDVCEGTAEHFASDKEFARRFLRQTGIIAGFSEQSALSQAADSLRRAMSKRYTEQFGLRIWEHADMLALIENTRMKS